MKVPPLGGPAVPGEGRRGDSGRCCRDVVCCGRRRKSDPADDDAVEVERLQITGEESELQKEESSTCVYSAELPPLASGHVITVEGTVLHNCERFSVNLCCNGEAGSTGEADLALHLNPRVSQRYVVRGSRLKGRWGAEETAAALPFPFTRGEPFVIDIFVADDAFHCQVNSRHFCSFSFRTGISRVRGVEIRGAGVEIAGMRMGEARGYPVNAPPPPTINDALVQPQWGNPAIGVLEEGLRRGRQLTVEGRVKLLPNSFYVNLQSSVRMWPHPDIPLHLNPRFLLGRKHIIVKNSWQNGAWEDEQRVETSHMAPGADFVLRISCEESSYSVWMGDSLAGVFMFRMAPERVRAVFVQGDVHVTKIYESEISMSMAGLNVH